MEVPSTNKRYRTAVRYLDRRYVYLAQPIDQGEAVELEAGTEVSLIVSGFGTMFRHPATVHGLDLDADPVMLMLNRTGQPERMESRTALRFSAELKATVQILGEDGSILATKPAILTDLSAGGGRIKLDQSYPNGTNLHLTCALAGNPEGIDTPAKVARVFPTIRKGTAELGVQFLSGPNLGDMITKWILSQQRRRVAR